jgi:hypothetical protein
MPTELYKKKKNFLLLFIIALKNPDLLEPTFESQLLDIFRLFRGVQTVRICLWLPVPKEQSLPIFSQIWPELPLCDVKTNFAELAIRASKISGA